MKPTARTRCGRSVSTTVLVAKWFFKVPSNQPRLGSNLLADDRELNHGWHKCCMILWFIAKSCKKNCQKWLPSWFIIFYSRPSGWHLCSPAAGLYGPSLWGPAADSNHNEISSRFSYQISLVIVNWWSATVQQLHCKELALHLCSSCPARAKAQLALSQIFEAQKKCNYHYYQKHLQTTLLEILCIKLF